MVKKTFIPNWYEESKSEIINKKVKLCIKITLIINSILLILMFNISNKIKTSKGQIGTENKTSIVTETLKKDTTIIEKYKELSNFFDSNNFIYNNIIITKDSLEIEVKASDYEEYALVVRKIEDHYSIKKLTPIINNEGNYNFKVIL